MELTPLIHQVATSDGFIAGAASWMLAETVGAAKNLGKDPARFFLNPMSAVAAIGVATGICDAANAEVTNTLINTAFIIGYCLPSAVRLLKEGKDWTEFSPVYGLATGLSMALINWGSGSSLHLSEIANLDSVRKTGDLISSVAKFIHNFKMPIENIRPLLNK